MKPFFGLCICLAAIFAVALAQRGNFRQFNNNFNNNNNFRPNNNFQQNNRQFQQQNNRPAQNFDFGLDTSDGRFAKFNGPVKGLPHGHGGGRYGEYQTF